MRSTLQPTGLPLCEAAFAFVDVETTGFDPNLDAVIELACVIVRDKRETDVFATLIDPGRDIPATASAVHHLTSDDVAGAPILAEVENELVGRCADAVIVAHNARFDLAFLPMLAHRPFICAMRFAQLVFPDAPNFKNQVLRYHLGIVDSRLKRAVAHRALGDAIVTSHVFARCLERYLASGGPDDVAALIAKVAAPIEVASFRFGKHRGEPLAAVPAGYLAWVEARASHASENARFAAGRELQRRADREASA